MWKAFYLHTKTIFLTSYSLFVHPFPFFVLFWGLNNCPLSFTFLFFSFYPKTSHFITLLCNHSNQSSIPILHKNNDSISFSISLSVFWPPFLPMSPFLTHNSIALPRLLITIETDEKASPWQRESHFRVEVSFLEPAVKKRRGHNLSWQDCGHLSSMQAETSRVLIFTRFCLQHSFFSDKHCG